MRQTHSWSEDDSWAKRSVPSHGPRPQQSFYGAGFPSYSAYAFSRPAQYTHAQPTAPYHMQQNTAGFPNATYNHQHWLWTNNDPSLDAGWRQYFDREAAGQAQQSMPTSQPPRPGQNAASRSGRGNTRSSSTTRTRTARQESASALSEDERSDIRRQSSVPASDLASRAWGPTVAGSDVQNVPIAASVKSSSQASRPTRSRSRTRPPLRRSGGVQHAMQSGASTFGPQHPRMPVDTSMHGSRWPPTAASGDPYPSYDSWGRVRPRQPNRTAPSGVAGSRMSEEDPWNPDAEDLEDRRSRREPSYTGSGSSVPPRRRRR